jgi:hypothetical protein
MTDHVVELMRRYNVPLTRANYVELAYAGEPPEPWTSTEEDELPPEIRDYSQVQWA